MKEYLVSTDSGMTQESLVTLSDAQSVAQHMSDEYQTTVHIYETSFGSMEETLIQTITF